MNIPNSQRLTYQLMQADNENDLHLLFKLNQYPEVMKYLNGGVPNTLDEIKEQFLPRLNAFTNTQAGWGLWKACDLKTDEFIGWILVRPMDFFTSNQTKSDTPQLNNLELGWRFLPESWGKGLATEAAEHVMNSISEQTGIKHFCAVADAKNTGSIAIMKRLGMQFIKSKKQHESHGEIDAVLYEITI